MTVIGTNISALRAQNGARVADSKLATAMERLSTGSKINSAKDDAAGLAISTRMTSQIRGYAMAIQNANDGISMMQTAEGAMGEVTNMLQRMRELAVQASSGTLSNSDRGNLQTETKQLMAEINNISKTANFNGLTLLDGSAKNLKLQTGVNSNENVSVSLVNVSTDALGLSGSGLNGQVTTGRIGSSTIAATTDLQFNGKDAVAAATYTTAKQFADAVNVGSATHGVKATAYNELTGTVPTGTSWAAGDISINGDSVGAANSVEELVSNINRDVAGVTASLKDGKIVLSNNTGEDIVVNAGANSGAAKAGFTAATYSGYVALKTSDGSDLTVSSKSTTGTAAKLQGLGLNVSADGGVSGTVVTSTAFTSTDKLSVNGVAIGVPVDTSAAAKAAAINAKSAETGVVATAKTTVQVTLDPSKFDGTNELIVNGVSFTPAANSTLDSIITSITGAGVTASADEAGHLILTSESGADITVGTTGSLVTGVKDGDGGTVTVGSAAHGTLTLTSVDGESISIEGTDTSAAKFGLALQGGAPGKGASGSELSIATQEDAMKALDTLDAALTQIISSRGDLGAVQNRLASTVNSLATTSSNLTDARSRIMDADFSAETTNLAKAQILSQAATAMLAQANQSQQNVMSLLR